MYIDSKMNICMYCHENALLETHENVTCTQCSRVQNELVFGDQYKIKYDKDIFFDTLEEIDSRQGLSMLEKTNINKHLNTLKMKKSTFSKHELCVSLLYIEKMKNNNMISPHAFCLSLGESITVKKMNTCCRYINNVLNIERKISPYGWTSILKPYFYHFKKFNSSPKNRIENACENIARNSNLSVFSTSATAVTSFLISVMMYSIEHSVNLVSLYSGISKATLTKNTFKHGNVKR